MRSHKNRPLRIVLIVLAFAVLATSQRPNLRENEAQPSGELASEPLAGKPGAEADSPITIRPTETGVCSSAPLLMSKPDGVHLLFYDGGPFEAKSARYYALNPGEASEIKTKAENVKRLKDMPEHNPCILSLRLSFGSDDGRWFFVLNDRKTLFYHGAYYEGSELAESVLKVAAERFGFVPFDTLVFSGITRAQYKFKTRTGVVVRSTEDKAILARIEKELQEAQYHMGGGCPFSDGVLTLTLEDGRIIDVSMASDDCPLMFVGKNFLKYSEGLHRLLRLTFDNFPYVSH